MATVNPSIVLQDENMEEQIEEVYYVQSIALGLSASKKLDFK